MQWKIQEGSGGGGGWVDGGVGGEVEAVLT